MTPSSKQVRSTNKGGKKRVAAAQSSGKCEKGKEDFSVYIYEVLKIVHPNTSVSCKVMEITNTYINEIFERIVNEASRLSELNGRSIISSRTIQTAVRGLFPGEMAKFADLNGIMALTQYAKSKGRQAFHSRIKRRLFLCPSCKNYF
jgi:histone H2B